MMTKTILTTLLTALAAVNAAPSPPSKNSCVISFAIPSLDPACLPLKAQGINAAPTPKCLFSDGDFCATYDSNYASLTLILDAVPAGKTCTVFSFTEAGCKGTSTESSMSAGCFQISTLPDQRSAKLVCE
ncbi:MAG: hypothetical protein Q9183_004522 [Haloplaca sp. 2 TL-2023]